MSISHKHASYFYFHVITQQKRTIHAPWSFTQSRPPMRVSLSNPFCRSIQTFTPSRPEKQFCIFIQFTYSCNILQSHAFTLNYLYSSQFFCWILKFLTIWRYIDMMEMLSRNRNPIVQQEQLLIIASAVISFIRNITYRTTGDYRESTGVFRIAFQYFQLATGNIMCNSRATGNIMCNSRATGNWRNRNPHSETFAKW